MLIGNIVNIVQHSHLYNSFILIIVACIVILLVVILYWDHVGFCVIVTFSSIHKLKWPVLLSYIVLTGMKPDWDRIDARLAHQMFSWNFDVILSLYIGLCRCVLTTCIDLILFWKAFSLYSCTSEPYSKICFDIIHIHCNKQLFFILTVSQ